MKKMFNKKFFLIFGSTIALLIVLSIGMILLTKENTKTFSKEGYIITSGKEDTTKYYFEEGTSYKKNINSQLVFTDKNGDKVAVETNNFMHYTDGGIKFLKNGVIMDLNSINNSTVPYYNITDKSVLQYSKKSYFIETIDKTLGFNNIAGRISENKYIFAGVNIKLQLAGNENIIEGDYFEVNYIEDGIIRVENHDASYQTTAEGSYILVDNIIKIDLGNKKIYYNDEEKMSLAQMTIDGNENIEIVPEEEDKGSGDGEGDGTGDGTGVGENGNQEPGTDTPGNGGTGNGDETPGNDEPGTEQPGADEPGSGDGEGDGTGDGTGTVTGNKRSATIEMTRGSVTSNSLSASFVVNDPDKAIEGNLSWRIINADSGVEIEKITENENISFRPEFDMGYSSLKPDTNYILTITEEKKNGKEIQYFQKLFRTEKLGIKLEKKYATQDSLAFELIYDEESEVKSATITIYKKTFEEKNGSKKTVFEEIDQEVVTKEVSTAIFSDLEPNTEYAVEVSNIIMNSTEWQDTYKINATAKTLKTPPYLKDLSVDINDENSIFTLGVDTVIDDHKSITKYTYYIYEADDIIPENMDNLIPVHTVTKYDSDDINIKIDGNPIKGKTDYRFKIVAEYFDNEKYGEFETIFSKNFILAGKPTIDFEQDYERTTINTIAGILKLTDVSCTVPITGRPCYSAPNNAYVEYEIPNYADEAKQQKIQFNPQTLEADLEVPNLLAGYNYSFKVWADVNLYDGKGVQPTLLGEFIVKTKDMDVLNFNWSKNPSKMEDLINLNVEIISPESNPKLGDSLYHMTVNLYSGGKAGELQNGSILTPLKSVKLSGDAVKAFYGKKSIINTLNTFGITEKVTEIYDEETGELIGTETTSALDVLKSLTDGNLMKNYTIEITDMYDEAESNRFEPMPGKNYYTFEVDNEFIIEQEMENPTIVVEPITNEMLNGLEKDDILIQKIGKYNSILSDTAIVGFKVDSIADLGRMQSEYHLNLKELIYYVCDGDKKPGCTIDEAVVVEKIDLTETNNTQMYFKVSNGTKFSAADTTLTRGHNYIFKLKISHEKSENNETVLKYYPSVDVQSEKIKTPKDTPSYRMYIENTTEDKANYIFEYRDIDNALYEQIIYYTVDDELKNTLNKPEEPEIPENTGREEGIIDPEENEEEIHPEEPGEEIPEEQPEIPVEPEEPKELEVKEAMLQDCKKETTGFSICRFQLDTLSTDSVYNVTFKRALIKKTNAIEDMKVGEYIFDGKLLYDKDTVRYYNATSENDNRLRIIIDKEATSEKYVNRISAYHVILSADGVEDYEKVFASNKVSTCIEGEISHKCLVVDYKDIKEFKKKNITVKVVAYYDNGIVDNFFTASNSNIASKLTNEEGYIIQENNYFNKQFNRAKYLNFSRTKNALKIGKTSNPIGNYYFDYASNSNIKLYKGIVEDSYSFTEEKDLFSIESITKFNDAFRIKENSGSKEFYQVNNKQLSITELGTDKNNFKFNSIIPKITVTTKGLVNGATVTIKANGVDDEILKDEFKEEKGKYYYYLNIYKDEEKTEKINDELIKAEINLETGSVIEFTKYLPDTTYYFEVFAYMMKEKEYKITQLFDSSDLSNYVTKLYTFSSLSPKEILSYGKPKVSYNSKTVDEQYLKRTLEIYVDTKNIGTYTTRYEIHDINGNKILEKLIEPKLQSGFYRSLLQEDITPTEESIKSGLDYVFGSGHYKLLMFVETDVEVSEEHPDGRAELLVTEDDMTLKSLKDPTYTVTRAATQNTLTFNVTISDTDKVIKDGKYCVELLDSGTNPLQGTQYKKCDLSVLELNKKIEFTGLKTESVYIFRVSSDVYTNNVGESKPQRSIVRDTVASTSTSYGMALGVVGANNQGTNAIVLTFNGGYMVNEKVKAVTYTITETVSGQSTSNKIASGTYIIGKDKNFIKSGLNYQLVIDPEGLKLTKKNEYFVDITYWLDTNMTDSFNDMSYPYTVTFND